MSLSNIVTVSITTSARGVSRAGFGTPLICGYHTAWMDYVREYSDLADMVTDGIAATTPIYKAATAILSSTPNVKTFKVGRRATAFDQTVDITPTVGGTGFVHSLVVVSPDGTSTTVTYTELVGDVVADIVTALQTPLNAISDVTATDGTTEVTCAADNSGELFFYNEMTSTLQLIDNTPDPGLAADLVLIRAEDDDWYGFCLDSNSEAEIKGAQAVIETLPKLAAYNTADWGAKDSGTSDDVLSDLETAAYDRCGALYSADHDGFAGAAWLGVMLVTDPGSATWAFKSLSGVNVDTLNVGQQNAILAKSANYYVPIKGFNTIFDGGTPGGSYVDIVRGQDWLTSRLEERIVLLLVSNPKVPFTDSGVDMVKSQVDAQLKEGQASGYLAFDPVPTVTAPLVADVSAVNKAARTLPDVNFTATLQGAIHTVNISGTISV